MGSESSNLKICFACATIYEGSGSQFLVCPNCGHKVSIEQYESILQDARDAMYFGWIYRLQYEHDLAEKGAINTHYYLAECEEIFNFIALAAVSGIVGNLAYDVIKKVIGSIADFVKQRGSQEENRKIFALIHDEEKMDKFLQYIDEYYTCFDDINEEVRNAILEEMIVDKVSSTLEQIIMAKNPDLEIDKIKEISPFSQEELFKGMIEVRRGEVRKDIERRKKLNGTAFQDFWSNMDERP
ncbi:MAG: hypothetical protein K2M42_01565 [Oscillospiraceae bacterium]|nr:hypothetical protein [Oscillospiraceae bacterium]